MVLHIASFSAAASAKQYHLNYLVLNGILVENSSTEQTPAPKILYQAAERCWRFEGSKLRDQSMLQKFSEIHAEVNIDEALCSEPRLISQENIGWTEKFFPSALMLRAR